MKRVSIVKAVTQGCECLAPTLQVGYRFSVEPLSRPDVKPKATKSGRCNKRLTLQGVGAVRTANGELHHKTSGMSSPKTVVGMECGYLWVQDHVNGATEKRPPLTLPLVVFRGKRLKRKRNRVDGQERKTGRHFPPIKARCKKGEASGMVRTCTITPHVGRTTLSRGWHPNEPTMRTESMRMTATLGDNGKRITFKV